MVGPGVGYSRKPSQVEAHIPAAAKGGTGEASELGRGVPRGRLLAHPCMLGSRTYTHEQLPLVNDTSVGTCGTRRGGNEEDSVVILSATPNNAEDVSEGP